MLTVGICSHNYADHLPECIRSAEKFADYIFIHDDASTDGSADIIRESGHDHLIAEANSGTFIEGFNSLIANARGDWLCILDADNILLTVPELKGDYVYGDLLLIDDRSRPSGMWQYHGWPLTAGEAFDRFYRTKAMPVPAGGFWNLRWIREHDLAYRPWPSSSIGGDFLTMLDWLKCEPELHYAPVPILAFRQHHGQQSGMDAERLRMMTDVERYLKGEL